MRPFSHKSRVNLHHSPSKELVGGGMTEVLVVEPEVEASSNLRHLEAEPLVQLLGGLQQGLQPRAERRQGDITWMPPLAT